MLIEENAKKSNEKLKKLQNQLKINENTQSLQLENSIYIEKVAALMENEKNTIKTILLKEKIDSEEFFVSKIKSIEEKLEKQKQKTSELENEFKNLKKTQKRELTEERNWFKNKEKRLEITKTILEKEIQHLTEEFFMKTQDLGCKYEENIRKLETEYSGKITLLEESKKSLEDQFFQQIVDIKNNNNSQISLLKQENTLNNEKLLCSENIANKISVKISKILTKYSGKLEKKDILSLKSHPSDEIILKLLKILKSLLNRLFIENN